MLVVCGLPNHDYNAQGYQTREYTTLTGKYRPSKPWSSTSVMQILKNPAYIGKRRAGDDVVNSVGWCC
ncbi:recombinase family protein [Candidatus Uabimicrobium sp. HlEnr_7]|uniref:recombinase family protein n=1 Tax=Candidatus Uabimicrobium helgolandensis TaxID=3095367 RepID=UPI003555E12D